MRLFDPKNEFGKHDPVPYIEIFHNIEILYIETLLYLKCLFSYDFCQPNKVTNPPTMNLGQIISGDRIGQSPYQFEFMKEIDCEYVCTKSYDDQLEELKNGMLLNYNHHWIVDNMPVTWCYPVESGQMYCSTGFPMGCYVDSKGNPKDACVISRDYSTPNHFYVFNHIDFVINYNDRSYKDGFGRILSVKMTPRSIDHNMR